MMIKRAKFLLLLALVAGATEVTAQDYDLVILRGRVMDPETKFDGVRNVGIKDGKIVAITGAGPASIPVFTAREKRRPKPNWDLPRCLPMPVYSRHLC
jgi:hypothetical protein